MPRILKATVQVNSQQLATLPKQAAAAAQGVQQRLAALQSGTAGGGALSNALQANATKMAAAAMVAANARAATMVAAAPPGRFGRGAGQRPTAVGGTSGSIGAGIFRGLAQEFGSLTGIGIPFLSLSPTFIAASAAASALSIALVKALSSVSELANGIRNLRQEAGGSLSAVSKLAATGRQFGVDTTDVASAVGAMRSRIEQGNPAVRRLGISLTDTAGVAKSYTQIFGEVQDVISQIKDPTLQASVAQDVFGDSYRKILPLLQQSTAVVRANAAAINTQARAGEAAVKQEDEFNRRVKSGENTWNQFWEGFGKNTVSALGFWADTFDKIQKNQEQDAASQTAVREAQIKGLGEAEVLAAGRAARARVAAEQTARTAITPTDIATAPELAVERMTALAAAAMDARQQSDQLNQSLLNIGQQRIQIAFQIGMAERNIANTVFDQQQSLANMAQDRAMHLQETVAALTISLNEFNKAEFTAEVRAREEEKSFFAFRPDNALRRANEQIRYDRDRAQLIARNERTNQLAADQLANQKEIADFELANLARQEIITSRNLELFNLTHEDIATQSDISFRQLEAAIIAQRNLNSTQNIHILLEAPGFSAEENQRIRDIAIKVIGEAAGAAIGLVRSNGGNANSQGLK